MKNRVEKQDLSSKTNRFMELEGLRGLAALVVVIFHFLVLFYPVIYYGGLPSMAPVQHFRLEDNIHASPFVGLLSGTFSVAIFFVLSGFVLSVGFFASGSGSIIKKLAVKRYFRLMLPALASIVIVWVYLKLGLSNTDEAYAISQSGALFERWAFEPNLFEAIQQGLIGIFLQQPVHVYNSVLWTMHFEFIGSFIIFGAALLFGRSNRRWMMYLGLVVLLFNTWFLGFILGMILADLYTNRQEIIEKVKAPVLYVLLLIGIILGGFPTSSTEGTLFEFLYIPMLTLPENLSVFTTLGALMVVFAVLRIVYLKQMLASRIMSNIGKYTYSLYLVHQPIIYTLGTLIFVSLVGVMGYNRSVAITFLLLIPVILIATLIFYRYIETPSMRFATYFEQVYSGKKDINIQKRYAAIRLSLAAKMSVMRRRKLTDMTPEIETE